MKTLEEFIGDWTNKPVDTDGMYPNQCMDLLHLYCIEVLGLTKAELATSSAYLVYDNFPILTGSDKFERIENTPYVVPQKGDIVIFNQNVGANGHVCIFIDGDTNTFNSFDANWPVGFLPHVQDHNYNGVSGWLHFKPQPMYTYKYKIGDILEPSVDIPVGSNRGNESMEYGHIGFKFQATVIGLYNGYYNIDQSAIGGGTGWVNAQVVDSILPFVQREEKPPVDTGKIYTETQYMEMQKERDEALAAVEITRGEIVDVNKTLTGFRALGITSIDDITKLKAEHDKIITGLNKQLVETLKRSTDLAEIIKKKDEEDFTAIELGMTAIKRVHELEDYIAQIAKNVGTRPDLNQILKKIWNIGAIADRTLKQAQKEKDDKRKVPAPTEVETAAVETKAKTGLDWLLNIFQLKGGGEK